MYAWSRRVVRTLEGVHCAILAVSTFLAGLYFGRAIPEGVELLMLQTSLVGVIAFLGLTHLSAVRHLKHLEDTEACQVEERLSRHIEPKVTRLVIHTDRASQNACHFPAKSAGQKRETAQTDHA